MCASLRFLSRPLLMLMVLSSAACDRSFESAALHATWKPPNGVELVSETPGAHARATFGHGVVLQSIDDIPSDITDPTAIGQRARQSAALPSAEGLDCRAGTLPAGPVVRCELAHGSDHELAYVVMVKSHSLLVDVAAPDSVYGPLSAKVESSLSTLRIR